MFLGILNSSIPLLSITLQFIALSLYTQEPRGSIAQTPLKMAERLTFTMRSSYTVQKAAKCIRKFRFSPNFGIPDFGQK